MALFGSKKTDVKEAKPAKKAVAPKNQKTEAVSMQDLYNAAPTVKTGAKNAKSVAASAPVDTNAHQVLVSPLVTEKATNLGAENKYVFIVSNGANKIAVKKAIQAVYGVTPVSVNIANAIGKRVARGRIKGQRSDWRKAIVTLKKGETIKIYEGV
jgi:large subunit ribosomal protein L23